MRIRPFDGYRTAPLRAALAAALAVLLIGAAGARAADRGYELVSPAEKDGAVPNFAVGINFGGITRAAADGDSLMWFAVSPLPGATNGLPMNYRSSRTSGGWVTRQASPDPSDPTPNVLGSVAPVVDATDDFSRGIVVTTQQYDPLIQSFLYFGRVDVYDSDLNGTLSWVSRPNSGPTTADIPAEYQGRDAAGDHIAFTSSEALVPAATGVMGPVLYERSGGVTSLVNVDSGGTMLGNCGAVLGYAPLGTSSGRHAMTAVSDDGSRIYFTTPNPNGSGDPSCSDPQRIYLRSGGTTVEISASQRTVPDPLGTRPATFMGASSDGSEAFFLSDAALTDSAANGTSGQRLLYQYDVVSARLTLLTPNDVITPGVSDVVGISTDGARIYFVAAGRLTADAPNNLQRKLYVYDQGQLTYIGTPADWSSFVDKSDFDRPLRITPDGRYLIFASSTNFTAYDSRGSNEIYRYDEVADTLQCISCPGGSVDAVGSASLMRNQAAFAPRWVSANVTDDGQKVFFDTPQALVSGDDNGVIDVYEWDAGQLRLISSGHDPEDSYFVDSAQQGRDVFFKTSEALVSQDVDGDADMYDARVGGGFSAPAVTPPAGSCAGDQCQGQPGAPPTLPGVTTGTDFGAGNAADSGPSATLRIASISDRASRRFAHTGRLRLVVSVDRAGRVGTIARAAIRGRRRVVARAAKRVSAAGRAVLVLRLSEAARRRLQHGQTLHVTIVATFPGAVSREANLVLVPAPNAKR